MASPNQKAQIQDALIAKHNRIDELLKQIQLQANRHFDLAPDDCHWGHVGDLDHLIEYLEHALGIEH
ncbi:hypothetical protein [Sansalvadorimonas verongulae]|uniref:hypothetical protein n=1 Tax=Sansalvadorimonas verongulae TaxID=2172824 RepID=UPI0012BC470A|nr:hypothetical protein [Sansalvadorimonas verongulae]MTI13015.1 hypothetical protein [Sansalvadorimonas verongulae]